jgi:hypothetical protein
MDKATRSSSVADPIGRATDILRESRIPGVLVALRKPSHGTQIESSIFPSSQAGSGGMRLPSSTLTTLGDTDLWYSHGICEKNPRFLASPLSKAVSLALVLREFLIVHALRLASPIRLYDVNASFVRYQNLGSPRLDGACVSKDASLAWEKPLSFPL